MSRIPEQVLQAVDRIPAFPKSVQQVLTLAADINCAPKDLVGVLKNDPIFTMKILKVVNSPFMGLSSRVTSIHQASVYLGVNTLKNLALSLAGIGMLPARNKAGFPMQDFWLHSLAVALVSRRLAGLLEVAQQESADFFSAGLLHDVGKAVLALYMPEAFQAALELARQSPLFVFEAEERTLAADHAEVGALVAQRWGFPEVLVQGIAWHHTPERGLELPLVLCVFAADQVCKTLRYGSSGEDKCQPLPPSVAQRFGRDLDGLVRALPDLDEELQKARIFINA